ncbi:BBE domain-containing protein [Pseudomonas sp. B329]|uniref:BBE domain-containing protein n=1 Tax=Pseudomonas sp. B329 TaxID=1553459 RepID=UPI002003C44D|nr:BBE domain-containing protein [Pseudomonas sp. B329]MCK3861517.1 FAD-binding oxidoreductase [Pseudomonas sp. B329]
MSNYILINHHDRRYETLKKGFNLRWPGNGQGADFIYICNSPASVWAAANDALKKNYRITVRSGGHCYEGFVTNKLVSQRSQRLAIIDLGLMAGIEFDEQGRLRSHYNESVKYKFRIASGNQNWDGFSALYKIANRTIPGGSCYSVGAGGHISGGGYGLLSRMHGLTVDWLSGVDILVPNKTGDALEVRHVHEGSDELDGERDLFIACRGAGGGNFGIILNYYFKELPQAPQQAYLLSLAWPWSVFDSKDKLSHFLNEYWRWFSKNDEHWNSDDLSKANGGLFALLKLQHRSTGDINLLVQYTGMDGRVDGERQTEPLIDFVTHMNQAAGENAFVTTQDSLFGPIRKRHSNEPKLSNILQDARLMDWLYVTQMLNGSGNNQHGKYKSFYQVGDFSDMEVNAIWQYFNQAGDAVLNQALLQIDSYGGCINAKDEQECPTSVYQRRSILKAQLQVYWSSPMHEHHCIEWCRSFYKAFFEQQGGKPFQDNQRYQGCYINYPDIDVKYTDDSHAVVDTRWLELYYGDKRQMLIRTKLKFDPKNIFRSELSIPLAHP